MIRFIPAPLRISAVLYLLVALLCTRIPLVNYLGFEFSFLFAFLASLVSGIVAIGQLSTPSDHAEEGSANLRRRFLHLLAAHGSLLLIPLAVISLNALFVKNCSFVDGVAFFLLLPFVSVWFSICLALFLTVHSTHPRIVFLAVVALTLLYAGFLGYTTPAIYSYNFFYGFFPGLTYDENLDITGTLILFRIVTSVLGFVLLWSALLIAEGPAGRSSTRKGIDLVRAFLKPGRRPYAALVTALFASLFFFRNELRFETHEEYIRSSLGSSVSSGHVTVYYADSSFSHSEALWLAAEHEFRLYQIERFLGFRFVGRLESYVYPSIAAKARFIGAGRTSIAKPWSAEMHLDAGTIRQVLKHEIVHLAAAPLGIPVLEASLYPGLTEGVAMAIEWDWGLQTLHEHAAAMLRHGVRPDMELIMGSLGFVRQSSSVSYVLAGSFCRYLADRYGADALGQVYAWGDYEAVFGKSLSILLAEWGTTLDEIVTDHGAFDRVDLFFRGAPIFDKTCPRTTANMLVEAGRRYSDRDFISASRLYRSAYEQGGSAAAMGGYIRSELRLGNTGPALAVPDSIRARGAPGHLLPLLITAGDAYWFEGRFGEAEEAFERVACAELSRGYSESALVRLLALEQRESAGVLRTLLIEGTADSARIPILDSLLAVYPENKGALYLRGLANLSLGRYAESVADLAGAVVSPRLEQYRLLSLGDGLLRMRRFEDARVAYGYVLGGTPTDGLCAIVADRIERCDWFESNSMPDAVGGSLQ